MEFDMSGHQNYQVKLDFKNLLKKLSQEFTRAIELSKKMLMAGRTNVELKDSLGELGLVIYKQLKSKNLNVDDQEIKNLIDRIEYLEQQMEGHEGAIQKVKTTPKVV